MPDVDVTTALPEGLREQLERYGALAGVDVRPIRLPVRALSEAEMIDIAVDFGIEVEHPFRTPPTALSPRQPWVDGVAWLDFETVAFYRSGDGPFASIGSYGGDHEVPPFLRLSLVNAPAGNGVLVTCRASGISVGPSYPGYFRVEGPGVSASFENTGHPTTFAFMVPTSGAGPVEIKIHTDPDRIKLWAFHDCTIAQL